MLNKNTVKNVGNEKSDEFDLGRLLGEIIDHRWLITGITTAFLTLSILFCVFSTPIYRANALIQVEQKQGNAILDNLSQMLPDRQPQSAPEISLLQSRMILGKTVSDLNLQIVAEQNYFPLFGQGFNRLVGNKPGEIKISHLSIPKLNDEDKNRDLKIVVLEGGKFKIVSDRFEDVAQVGVDFNKDGVSLTVDKIDAPVGTEFNVQLLTQLEAIVNLQKDFTVEEQGKDTGMLNLAMTGDDPQLIGKILESISRNYLQQNIDRQAAQDSKSLDFLDQKIPKVRSELYLAEDKLNSYRRQKDSVDLNLEAQSVLNRIVNVDNQLNELTFKEAEISQLYTKDHPTYNALMQKRETLQQEKSKLNKQISAMPATQQEVLRLSRDVESGRAVYMQLLNRQQELNIAKSSAIGNVRIIDNAITEPKPVKPKKALIVIIGVFLGGFISIGVVLVNVFLRRGIESPEQLEEQGINVYASIPVSEWLQKNTLSKAKSKRLTMSQRRINESGAFLAVENPADLAIEAIRGLRTSLHFAMMESANNAVMISGASPSAGKTFVSTNLASVIAQSHQKVLLIDADMRKGYVHKLFNVNNDNGLSDYLVGKAKLEDAIKPVKNAGFDFISRGQVPPNPAELLMHDRFKELLEWATKTYDLVMIDTPPILAVTDAAIIGRYAGTTLLVARFENNTVKEIDVSIKRFEQSGVPVKGCILNGVVKKVSSYYGYGYNYYGYNYDDKKSN
ncbi:polysaccharide biosynthesis tyrosine autokinase [Serratia marcescens]|uniref:Tyrosine protein kinase n=1 Tax=Serratia marcescens TaxID=615 RepID=A0A656VGS4_SERMA|nr:MULTISPECIES: polysaccharide biosynthesis tyrosine autokinase [Serratia]ASM20760.1 tyrosine-protein kinase [Serratia marcescens]ASM25529.1 tyrosine-protein kinase [Serratia marcescens]AVU29796.1 tyrosine-protein kinase [Serratia marcescens]KAB1579594.1 polysaccharide biosynthesis tyrosine autokinase [Serratia marcescens]KMU51436.1 tyrosine protein kinase [Serratia marcescens]